MRERGDGDCHYIKVYVGICGSAYGEIYGAGENVYKMSKCPYDLGSSLKLTRATLLSTYTHEHFSYGLFGLLRTFWWIQISRSIANVSKMSKCPYVLGSSLKLTHTHPPVYLHTRAFFVWTFGTFADFLARSMSPTRVDHSIRAVPPQGIRGRRPLSITCRGIGRTPVRGLASR